jgi:hypothetical protein
LLEDRHPGHGEEFRQILCGQGVPGLLDLICDAHLVEQHFSYFRPDPHGQKSLRPIFGSSGSNGVGFTQTMGSQLQSHRFPVSSDAHQSS